MSEQKFTNEELAQRVIDGDHEALNLLYNQNKGLITKKCKEAYRWCDAPEKADFEELNQEAALSFVMSAPKYNPELGIKFSTFIGNCVFNHMIDYIERSIKTSCTELIIHKKTIVNNDLNPDYKKDSSSNILLQDYWQKKCGLFSISAEKAFFINYFYETIKNALDLLSPRQQKIISYRFGLGGEDEYCFAHTIDETSDYYGISKRDVVQIQKTSLRKMRKYCYNRLAYITYENCKNIENIFDISDEDCSGFIQSLPENPVTSEGQYDMNDIENILFSCEDYDYESCWDYDD